VGFTWVSLQVGNAMKAKQSVNGIQLEVSSLMVPELQSK
jgi:hypothetical protein